MEDVVQPRSMERLLASVAAEGQCFYYAHSGDETASRGSLVGEFYGQDRSKLISLSHEDAWKVAEPSELRVLLFRVHSYVQQRTCT